MLHHSHLDQTHRDQALAEIHNKLIQLPGLASGQKKNHERAIGHDW